MAKFITVKLYVLTSGRILLGETESHKIFDMFKAHQHVMLGGKKVSIVPDGLVTMLKTKPSIFTIERRAIETGGE